MKPRAPTTDCENDTLSDPSASSCTRNSTEGPRRRGLHRTSLHALKRYATALLNVLMSGSAISSNGPLRAPPAA